MLCGSQTRKEGEDEPGYEPALSPVLWVREDFPTPTSSPKPFTSAESDVRLRHMGRRALQASISVLAIASFLLGTAYACACPHHHPDEEPSCHRSLEANGMTMADGIQDDAPCLAESDECVCDSLRAKIVARLDVLKLKKHAAHVSIETIVTVVAQPLTTRHEIAFEKPFYLTDSFYNLSPKRGPPVL